MAKKAHSPILRYHPKITLLFYDRHRRKDLKRLPIGSPFVLPRVGELVRLPIPDDIATEYCVVDIRYTYRDSGEAPAVIECAGLEKKPSASEKLDETGMQLDVVRIELDPLL